MINWHELSLKVAKKEGKKKSVSIAQIKEILKIVKGLLSCQKCGLTSSVGFVSPKNEESILCLECYLKKGK